MQTVGRLSGQANTSHEEGGPSYNSGVQDACVRIVSKQFVCPRTRVAVFILLAVMATSPRLLAQASSEFTHPATDPTHDLTTKEFAKDILLNFRALISPGNAELLVAGGVLTGLSVIPEQNIEVYFDRGASWGTWTKPGRYVGASALVGGASALLFAVSRGSQDRRFRSFSYAVVQGMIVNESLVQVTKPLVGRERPNHRDRRRLSVRAHCHFLHVRDGAGGTLRVEGGPARLSGRLLRRHHAVVGLQAPFERRGRRGSHRRHRRSYCHAQDEAAQGLPLKLVDHSREARLPRLALILVLGRSIRAASGVGVKAHVLGGMEMLSWSLSSHDFPQSPWQGGEAPPAQKPCSIRTATRSGGTAGLPREV